MTLNSLEKIIIQKIKSQGPIPFDEFMEMALYYPELGYYTRKSLKIGREGDFFTASHLGKVFGIILTKAILQFWQKMGCPADISIVEVGPGMGYLAQDILEEVTKEDKFSQVDFKYILVEINPELIKIQQHRLKKFLSKSVWKTSIEELAQPKGIIICNEILDSLPVRVFQIINKKPFEVYVDFDEKSKFKEVLLPARSDSTAYLEEFAPGVFQIDGYRSEIHLKMKDFIKKLDLILSEGYVIVFDYGFEKEEYYSHYRTQGTLLCYYKHTVNENPYINLGFQDITSHVNFSAFKKWAKEVGFNVEEYTSQSKFLISFCDEKLLIRFQKKDLINKFKRVVLPQGMGETHKVVILSKNLKP
jgi:SAM-dependent MidA family methyltransferase